MDELPTNAATTANKKSGEGSGQRPAAAALTTTATAKLIAELQGGEVAVVEAALVSVRDAFAGERALQAENMLLEQSAILQALAVKLFRYAGGSPDSALSTTYLGLALRALDLSRKSLMALVKQPTSPQANVQVNLGSTNELLGGHGERLDG